MSEEINKNETNIGGVLIGATIATMWILYFWSLGVFYSILSLLQWLSIHAIMGAFGIVVTLYVWDKAR